MEQRLLDGAHTYGVVGENVPYEIVELGQAERSPQRLFFSFCDGGPSTYGNGWKGIINRLVAWRGEGMWHVEPVFIFSDGSILAWHNTAEGPIECVVRDPNYNYAMNKWHSFEATFTVSEMDRMWAFFCEQKEKSYNWRGLMFNFVPGLRWILGTSEGAGNSWFCSEFVMAALKRARPDEFGQYLSSQTTIRELYEIMRKKQCFSPVITAMGDVSKLHLQL